MAYIVNDPHGDKGLCHCLLPPMLAAGHRSAVLLSCRLHSLLPNVERILRNTGIRTEPGDVQPARPLALDQIAPESHPLIADFSRHGPLQDRARSLNGVSLAAAQRMSFHSRLPIWEVNGEAVVGLLPNGEFVRIYYEDANAGNDAIERLAGNYQEFVATVLEELEESGLQHLSDQVRNKLEGLRTI
jgi:hypothetical protein